jgi:uncharacterized membrane protein (DUF2068 family)
MKKKISKLIAAGITGLYLVYIWAQQDLEAAAAVTPAEEMPLVTAGIIALSVGKVALLALGLWLARKLTDWLKKRK